MRLIVDVGNTRIKWAWCDSGRLTEAERMPHRDNDLTQVLERAWGKLPPPAKVCVGNVAGAHAAAHIEAWATAHWRRPVRFVASSAVARGVRNAYMEPEHLGVDRWAALVAARNLDPEQAWIVVDCGTVLTVDVLDADGTHRGGLMIPGLARMRSCLRESAPALREIQIEATVEGFQLGKNTPEGIKFGTVYAVKALIEHLPRDLTISSAVAGASWSYLLTGGAASQLQPLLTVPCRLEPELVLQGIALLADERRCA